MATCRFAALLCVVASLFAGERAAGQLPEKKFITPDGKRPSGLFAPGVMVGKTLYIAGKGDYKPNEEFPGKVKNCLGEIEKTLKQAGLGFEHVVKSFVYLEDHDKYDELNKYYGEFFPKNPPARTTLGVSLVPGDSRLEITCIAYADLAERKSIGQPPANRPYTPGVLAGDTLYISGKGDQNADGSHPATFEDQVRQCMRNVEATLKDAGLDFRHVVMSNIFVDDASHLVPAFNVYGSFFDEGNQPACAPTVVDWIPGGSHVEITCIATTDLNGRRAIRRPQPGAASPFANASLGVWAGNTLYLSSMIGTADGRLTEGVDAQVHQIGRNTTALLQRAGLTLEDIVSGHVYLSDLQDYDKMNSVYRQYFSKGPGVRTTLMPAKHPFRPEIAVRASFIATRTQPTKP